MVKLLILANHRPAAGEFFPNSLSDQSVSTVFTLLATCESVFLHQKKITCLLQKNIFKLTDCSQINVSAQCELALCVVMYIVQWSVCWARNSETQVYPQ